MDEWRDQAACLNEDPERFFPSDLHSNGPLTVEAKAFCRVYCTVRTECLTWAIERGEDWGVWGGTTPAERRGTSRARQNLAEGMCRNGHPWTSENVREDRRGNEYCLPCRQMNGHKSHTLVRRREVLEEQFPPVEELVRELPGVRDRKRHSGRRRVPSC